MGSIGDLANDIARTLYEFRVAVAIVSAGLIVLVALAAHRLGWIAAAHRHPRRTGALVALALVVTVPVAWYLGSPIFIRTSLVEPQPSVAPVGTPGPSPVVATPSAPEPSAPSAQPAPTATPFVARTVTTGDFTGTDDFHFGRGTASIIEIEPGRYRLQLDAFSVRNGPDLFVYLSPDIDGYTDDSLELGRLKATDGAFGYDLPDDVDPARFRSALIWCKQFSHLFAVAPFRE